MVISYNWLLEYLPVQLSINELSKILTSIGLEVEQVETVEAIKGSLEGLVIGEVLTCAKHPNADKLSVTTVSIGGETPLHIVCGAPNVAAGQRVVVAPVGATVHPIQGEAFEIKKAKIRGELSEGMICAEDEIGLGNQHNGILILPEDAPIGQNAKTYFNVPAAEYAIHIGLTPNRSDAMSHIGVAKDVCAYLTHHTGNEHRVKMPETTLPQHTADAPLSITVQNEEACPRYTGLSFSGVVVGDSPEWLKRKLQTIGVRSINNVVDITNFVLHEYGQPLHAFDEGAIKGKSIQVKTGLGGSTFKTLDGNDIQLTDTDLMICDAESPMCLAGVYGGAASGVTTATQRVFLESAYFNPQYIRRSSLHHGLRTDAATHFEKAVDVNWVIPALMRAAHWMVTLTGATITSSIIDHYPTPLISVTIVTTQEYICRLSGKSYSNETIQTILKALGFAVSEKDGTFTIEVPSNKADVLQPADIVEEIVRLDGLDNIVIPEKINITLLPTLPSDRKLKEKIAEMLCAQGLQEIVTNSVTNSKYYPGNDTLVAMINSLSSELDILRPCMLESGLEVVSYNINRKSTHLALFEFGKTYHTSNGSHIEEEQLAMWFTGNAQETSWNTRQKPFDAYYVKGVLQNIFLRNGIHKLQTGIVEDAIVWKYKNQTIAQVTKVNNERLKRFDIKQPVFFAVIHWDVFVKAAAAHKIKYAEVPKYPSVQRDLALVIDKAVTYAQVQQATDQLQIPALQDYHVFDVFENEKLGDNKKSYALSYRFQLKDKTLTDTEIEAHMQALIKNYETKLNATIRQ